jgi:hypothetical protein
LTVIHLSFSITILAEKKFEELILYNFHKAKGGSGMRQGPDLPVEFSALSLLSLLFQPCLREAPPKHLICHELLAWAGAMRMAVALEQSSQRLLYDSTNTKLACCIAIGMVFGNP